jgi:hypothetical protein
LISFFFNSKESASECARKVGCLPIMQSEAQIAACKMRCPKATYCNGAESIMTSTIAFVAAMAFVRL